MHTNATRAIEHLEAIQISPRRWAHYDAADRSWWKISQTDLEILGRMMRDPQIGLGVAYSEWCAAGYGSRLPDGWTPPV